jgi:hypothetical protein
MGLRESSVSHLANPFFERTFGGVFRGWREASVMERLGSRSCRRASRRISASREIFASKREKKGSFFVPVLSVFNTLWLHERLFPGWPAQADFGRGAISIQTSNTA